MTFSDLSHGVRNGIKSWILAVFVEHFFREFTGLLLFVETESKWRIANCSRHRIFNSFLNESLRKIGKKFEPKWNNYELAAGVARKDDDIREATLLTLIGDEAFHVYNAFTWDSDHDKVKIANVLEQFEKFGEPRKNTIFERYLFNSRGQESGEPIDKYATVLRNMADSCEFRDLKDSLIRYRIVFGVTDNLVRQRLLRVPDLMQEKALTITRAAEATLNQLKQMQNIQEVNWMRNKGPLKEIQKSERKKPASGGEKIDCKFCGRRHVRDRMKCPVYGQQCNKCGKNDHFAMKCQAGKSPSEKSRAEEVALC